MTAAVVLRSEQTQLLADPSVEAVVATALIDVVPECPLCYFAARESRVVDGRPWPQRRRWEAKAQTPCSGGCGRMTFWCSGGPWQIGKPPANPLSPTKR